MRTIRAGLAALFFAIPLAAQMRESVTVEVIDVPVYVYNGDGPVRNLTKDDFDLYVNGRKRNIDYFDAVDFSPATRTEPPTETATVAPRDPRERRLFLLLFDLVFSRSAAVARARKAAVDMIDAAAPTDYFAVATFTRTGGVRLIVPFSNDRTLARHAAATLAEPTQPDPLSIAMSKTERGNSVLPWETGGKHSSGELLRNETVIAMYYYDSLHDNENRPVEHLMDDQIAELDRMAARMGLLEGFKHVVLFSEGFPPALVYTDSHTADGVRLGMMSAMYDSFRRANAVVDTVDIGDNAVRGTGAGETLRMFASETGGQFIGNRNDVKGALEHISTISATGYRLGFARPADAKEGANTIEVKVRNAPRGTTVSYRKGFSTTKPETSEVDTLRLADIMLNDIPQTGIPPRIEFVEKPFVEVQIPDAAIEKDTEGTVLFYVFDSAGVVVTAKQQRVKGGAIVRGKLDLPPGSYVAKAIVQSGSSIGFTRVGFAIR